MYQLTLYKEIVAIILLVLLVLKIVVFAFTNNKTIASFFWNEKVILRHATSFTEKKLRKLANTLTLLLLLVVFSFLFVYTIFN